MKIYPLSIMILTVLSLVKLHALERPDITYKIFQFPADKIPRIDGEIDDWEIVPESYRVRTDQMVEDEGRYKQLDPETLDICVRVGWVKGLNRLYFLYEAYDNYWDFSLPDLHNDTFEIVVDGDASGGVLIDKGHREMYTSEHVGPGLIKSDERIPVSEANWAIHSVHAQNYHIFAPAENKAWTLVWGVQPWIKELPFANAAYSYDFKAGESGNLVLEFWITPFDYAGPEGPERAVPSVLEENKIIGLAWAVIDYDDVNSPRKDGFWNLSSQHRMYGQASYLCAFQLMPVEAQLRPPIKAQWSFSVLDMDIRRVAFRDESLGKITGWKWDFGDGHSSEEQHPFHQYEKPGSYTVILDVSGSEGESRMSKVWEVTVK